jgi:hypothetical protein
MKPLFLQLPCSGGCTRQLIAPECREEIFGFENGMECRGCPIDICKGQLPIGGGNIDLDSGGNWRNRGLQSGILLCGIGKMSFFIFFLP